MYIMMFSHYFPPEGNAPASRAYEIAETGSGRVTVLKLSRVLRMFPMEKSMMDTKIDCTKKRISMGLKLFGSGLIWLRIKAKPGVF